MPAKKKKEPTTPKHVARGVLYVDESALDLSSGDWVIVAAEECLHHQSLIGVLVRKEVIEDERRFKLLWVSKSRLLTCVSDSFARILAHFAFLGGHNGEE